MAEVITLGSYNLLTGALKYEHGSWRYSDSETGYMISLGVFGQDTVANLVNAIESIDDELSNAIDYVADPRNPTPVWFSVNANGENAKRALVLGGTLSEGTRSGLDPVTTFGAVVGTLVLYLGPWEATSATTAINSVEFDWDDPTQAVTSVPGERDARIEQVRVGVPSDGVTEQTPLVKGWIGIRPQYQGYTDFWPVWDAEYGTSGTDTAIASVDDSNTSPTSSTANNVMQCTFATTATMAKRLTIHLDQINLGRFPLVTNGDAETGDTTGWTSSGDDGAPAASSTGAHVHSGTYGFRVNPTWDGAANELEMYQQAAATEGQKIRWSFWVKDLGTVDGDAWVAITWRDGAGDLLSTIKDYGWSFNTMSSWTEISGTATAPASTGYVRITVGGIEAGALESCDYAIDDIQIWKSYTDDWIGDYLVLCRCKLVDADSDATVQLQMKTGYASTTYKDPRPIVPPISHTDWKLIPLGEISFPPGRATTDDTSLYRINKMGLELWAELLTGDTGGTDRLDIDAFFFVPSKHLLYCGDAEICRSSFTNDQGASTYDYSYFRAYRRPDDRHAAISNSSDFGGIDTNIELSMPNFYLPVGNNIVVAAFERSASHELADEFTIYMTDYPRFRNRNTT